MIYGFSDEHDAAAAAAAAPEQQHPPPRSDWAPYRSGGGGAISHPDSPDETPVARLGGLRVANRTSIDSDDEDEWSQDALRQLNLNNRQ